MAASGRKQPLLMVSGECPLYPKSSHSAGSISHLLSGCF
jgi:hypothetical protein